MPCEIWHMAYGIFNRGRRPALNWRLRTAFYLSAFLAPIELKNSCCALIQNRSVFSLMNDLRMFSRGCEEGGVRNLRPLPLISTTSGQLVKGLKLTSIPGTLLDFFSLAPFIACLIWAFFSPKSKPQEGQSDWRLAP